MDVEEIRIFYLIYTDKEITIQLALIPKGGVMQSTIKTSNFVSEVGIASIVQKLSTTFKILCNTILVSG